MSFKLRVVSRALSKDKNKRMKFSNSENIKVST